MGGDQEGTGFLSQATLQMPLAKQEPAPPGPEVPVRAFRVVCDNMLGGLARRLRCLGADVLVLGANDDHRRAAEVSVMQARTLKSGKKD